MEKKTTFSSKIFVTQFLFSTSIANAIEQKMCAFSKGCIMLFFGFVIRIIIL